jgi:hypothetical protein
MVIGLFAIVGTQAMAKSEADPKEDVTRLLKSAGAVSVASKQPYGGGIDSMHIGFDADGKAVVGVALRKTKTYAEAMAVVSVTPAEKGYTIKAAEIPTIKSFHGKSQTYAKDALKDIAGRSFESSKDARGLVDAVSGATKYYKAIYVSYALMSSKVIDELTSPPDWKQSPIE